MRCCTKRPCFFFICLEWIQNSEWVNVFGKFWSKSKFKYSFRGIVKKNVNLREKHIYLDQEIYKWPANIVKKKTPKKSSNIGAQRYVKNPWREAPNSFISLWKWKQNREKLKKMVSMCMVTLTFYLVIKSIHGKQNTNGKRENNGSSIQ